MYRVFFITGKRIKVTAAEYQKIKDAQGYHTTLHLTGKTINLKHITHIKKIKTT